MPSFLDEEPDGGVVGRPVSPPHSALRSSMDKQPASMKSFSSNAAQRGSLSPDGVGQNGVRTDGRPLENGHRWETNEAEQASATLNNGFVDGEGSSKVNGAIDGVSDSIDGVREAGDVYEGQPEVGPHGDLPRTSGSAQSQTNPITNGDGVQPSTLRGAEPESPVASVPKEPISPAKASMGPSQMPGAADSSLRVPAAAHRLSSPPAFASQATSSTHTQTLVPSNPPSSQLARLQQRHTLEVPRLSTARMSREFPSANTSEDVLSSSGRFSPTTHSRRRGSITLARKATRSINSDMHLDEVPQDEDAARWADHIRQKRASKRKKRDEEDDDRVVVGTKVDQNHVNWVTAYNMLTGIRFTVSRTNAKLDRDLTDADFEAKHKFSFDITGNELTPSAKYDFKFKDYAPWVFRHLRAIFRLDPADYLMSLTSKYILSELGSPGKSGSFFYFSRDYKYIIKTIHHSEHKFLRKILKNYYHHVQSNPDTLLSQFYGLHRVKIPYGRKIHFVVMNNLFPPHRDIHRTFDLKGSTVGRDFREEELEKNPRATLKDLNWLRRNMHLEFGPTKKHAFIEQLKKDVKLLEELKIMDYSLLVGIHDLERGNEENLRDKILQVFQPGGENAEEAQPSSMLMRTPSKLENERKAKELRQIIKNQKPIPLDKSSSKMPDEMLGKRKDFYFYSDDGGFRATREDDSPGEEIYYLGIIDCLTHYNMIKRTEHFLKSFANDETQISAVPPDRYSERFVRFISSITMTREAAERGKASGDGTVDESRLSTLTSHRPLSARIADRTKRHAATEPEPEIPDRTLLAVRSPSSDRGELGSTLPVVEEAVESQSMGARSAHSREEVPPPASKPPATPPKDGTDFDRPPPAPPKDGFGRHERPPTPPQDEKGLDRAHSRGRGRDKELPLLPAAARYTASPSPMKGEREMEMRVARVSG